MEDEYDPFANMDEGRSRHDEVTIVVEPPSEPLLSKDDSSGPDPKSKIDRSVTDLRRKTEQPKDLASALAENLRKSSA